MNGRGCRHHFAIWGLPWSLRPCMPAATGAVSGFTPASFLTSTGNEWSVVVARRLRHATFQVVVQPFAGMCSAQAHFGGLPPWLACLPRRRKQVMAKLSYLRNSKVFVEEIEIFGPKSFSSLRLRGLSIVTLPLHKLVIMPEANLPGRDNSSWALQRYLATEP